MVSERVGWSIVAGLTYAVFAGGFAYAIGYYNGYTPLSMAAIVSAFGFGFLSWYWLVEGRTTHTLLMAGVSGLLTGTLSHVTMWIIYQLWRELTGLTAPYMTPFKLFLGMIGGTVLSLIYYGWLTAILAILGGLLLGGVRVWMTGRE